MTAIDPGELVEKTARAMCPRWFNCAIRDAHRAAAQAVLDEVVPAVAARLDLEAHLERQRAWSRDTFGPGGRTKGIVAHIRKELREIEANPTDLVEWIDVAILAFDGALRTGASPRQIADALASKQLTNETRKWPDWRTADPDAPIEHVRDGGPR